jgi:hypothetical protein
MAPGDRTPLPNTVSAWLEACRRLVTGDEEAEAQGFLPLTEPNREVLRDIHQRAETTNQACEEALTVLQASRERLNRTTEEVDDLISEILATIRLTTRKLTPVASRQLMRTLGFRFIGEGTEPVETQPVTT